MAAKNIDRDTVKVALQRDGWTITHDPPEIKAYERKLQVDLGAEDSTLGAERSGRKIAVEIQSFLGKSPVTDLQKAMGQYIMYRFFIKQSEPDREIYLAVSDEAYAGIFSEAFGRSIVTASGIHMLVYDAEGGKVTRWID